MPPGRLPVPRSEKGGPQVGLIRSIPVETFIQMACR
ncbi:hypothetical protein RBWH47_05338 [Rhodopirellula baltica WH47]|uniref:Uncharacterized protein n=2 Tax=Rhodopirellula baltica TaxID=265606 RepID=F2B0Q1_RHOBT|nr:hypothetical protein RBWH47_05338 [Rhodopirellula baltica WH47]ELP34166.1 hypothetical protein RBSWK_01897 [Rhodopirellula baltica SWK14]